MAMEFWSFDHRLRSHDLDLGNCVDAPVPKVLMPVFPACACGLPTKYSAQVSILGPVTFDLGDMTLTLCIPHRDGSTPHGALTDMVSFYLVGLALNLHFAHNHIRQHLTELDLDYTCTTTLDVTALGLDWT